MLSEELEELLQNSIFYAKKNKNKYVTVEHLLAFSMFSFDMEIILSEVTPNKDKLVQDIFLLLNKHKNSSNKLPLEHENVKLLIQSSLKEEHLSEGKTLKVIDIISNIWNFLEPETIKTLKENFLEKDTFLKKIKELKTVDEKIEENQHLFMKENEFLEHNNQKSKEKKDDTLIDLEEKLLNTDAIIINREEEVNKILQILLRKDKSNAILVGEDGVGKTSVIKKTIFNIIQNKDSYLEDIHCFELNLTSLLAGTKYRGDLERKLKKQIDKVLKHKNPIIVIEDIHQITKVGESTSSTNIGEMLKPFLNDTNLKIIGTTSFKSYKESFQKNESLNRRFNKVIIEEPSIDESIDILNGIKKSYEDYHNISFSKEAIQKIVKLSEQFMHDKFLPDCAIDLLDVIGGKYNLHNNNNKRKKSITIKEIENAIEDISNVKNIHLENGDKKNLKLLEKKLKEKLIGQNEAIEEVVDNILINKAKLSNTNKSIASFLFLGPTGVGKTELSKQLANELNIDFIKFDMSEYMEKHSVSKLIGAPSGYIGYEEGGLLIETIKKHPHSVIVFDEIEKAHSSITNILLQLLDEGTVTDNHGYKGNFRNCIFIMTSNLGTKEKNSMNFFSGLDNQISEKTNKAVTKFFSPEIINRIDSIIEFNSLENIDMNIIVNKHLDLLNDNLIDEKIEVSLTKSVIDRISELGLLENMGARPIERNFKRLILKKVSREILFNKTKKNKNIEKISLDLNENNEIVII